jgi:hypothetical protein
MKKYIITILIALIAIMGYSQGPSQKKTVDNADSKTFKQALNFCPGGPIFGVYALNYEYLFKPHHGMLIRFDYEAVPKSYTDANIESSGVAFILNYRYHFSGKLGSPFIGTYARYKIYSGNGALDSQEFDFKLNHFTLGLNAGKRWVWNSGFNMTFQLGYGFDASNRTATPGNSSIESTLDIFEKSYDFIDPFFGELSIGFAF